MCGKKIKLFIVFRRKDVHANIGNEKKDTNVCISDWSNPIKVHFIFKCQLIFIQFKNTETVPNINSN